LSFKNDELTLDENKKESIVSQLKLPIDYHSYQNYAQTKNTVYYKIPL